MEATSNSFYSFIVFSKTFNRYLCSKCESKHDASKQLLLGPKLPRVVVLHFKRFAQDLDGSLRKLTFPVAELPERLDVLPFTAVSTSCAVAYRLVSIVEHLGSTLRSGHYVCYCRCGEKWVMISDTSVRASSLGEALSSQA